jgi:beta-glucosidase
MRRPTLETLLIGALVVACASPAPVPSPPGPSTPTPIALPTAASTTPSPQPSGLASPSQGPAYLNASLPRSARVSDLLGRMTLEEKVGQMTLIERSDLRNPMDVATYNLGGVLSGGGSAPLDNTPGGWANMVDTFEAAALSTRLRIPILYGTDSVHGDGNLLNSTIFPHNIGIGATRDTELARLIGRATAEETAATGANWTFSPCLCVARDIRWGRTYESFSEDPKTVADFSSVITGYQGETLGNGSASILATAKHYLGDGGTSNGVNEGDTKLTEDQLRTLQLPPYKAAVEDGVGSVMVSFSSVNGIQMHANAHLINDVLKTELGFDGFVVSDWQAINRIDGARNDTSREDVSTAVNAGVDMIMVPFGAAAFEATLTKAIGAGDIPQQRVDDAVRRILGVKIQLGLFEHPLTDRSLAATVGSAKHRALARRAVAESLVVLKNKSELLPLKKSARVLVAGKNADDIGAQSGGWTVTWQGATGPTTTGTSILEGIRAAVGSAGTVAYDESGAKAAGYDVAIAVLGEEPYAESQGDRNDGLELDAADRQVLANLNATGIPIVVVLVSGRPLVITEQLPDMAALVAAWLPGTEGAGVADVLFGDAPAVGKLGFSWPRSADQLPLNVGDPHYDPLFPFGFGLTLPSGR